MTDSTTHINTLHVQAPEEAAQQVRLRLSTKLGGADLHPPGLAPAQVLLVRDLADPEPGRLGVDNAGAMLDRTWERAVRDALSDCLRCAVRPSNGRLPPDAEAVLFRDAAEAWACWGREQVAREPSAAGPWWTQSLETLSNAPSPPAGQSPGVAAVWRARPRLVPAMAAHLAAWDVAVEVVRQLSETEAVDILQTVCTAFDAPPPPTPQVPADRADEEETAHRSAPSIPDEQRQTDEGQPDDAESEPTEAERPPDVRDRSARVSPEDVSEEAELEEAKLEAAPPDETTPEEPPPEGAGPEELGPEAASVRRPVPPWRRFVKELGGVRLADALAGQPSAHRQLLGLALALRESPVTVRSPAFQAAWQAWRQAPGRPVRGSQTGEQEAPSPSPAGSQDRLGGDGETAPGRSVGDGEVLDDPDEKDRSSRRGESSADEDSSTEGDSSVKDDFSTIDDPGPNGGRRAREEETTPAGDGEEAWWEGAYTATDLGGILYLVNVLDALDLPTAAETPPLGEHVGAWAVLEALARALLSPDEVRPDDPLWHVLATLDGRRPETPAGQALANAEVSPKAFRMPPEWLDAPHVEPPLEGWWTVESERLRVWTDLGCVADRTATDEPVAQAEAEWDRVPNTGPLQRAESSDAMPLAPEPNACAPALARWAARTAPYERHRLAAALGVDDRTADWTADLFHAEGKLYTTDTHVDLLLPLDAARIDARVAGLDRSPGWWPAGGRVVRIHFRETDV